MITSTKPDDQPDEPNSTAHINNINNNNNNNNSYNVTNHNGTSVCLISNQSVLDVDQRRSNQEILSDIDRLAGNKDEHDEDGRRAAKRTSLTSSTSVQLNRILCNNGSSTNTIGVRQSNGDLVTDIECFQK